MAKLPVAKKAAKKVTTNSVEQNIIDFISKSKHPLKEEMLALRELILKSNKEITEHIKWNAPSFCIDGDDRITYNLSKSDYILLVFHRGAKVKDTKGKDKLYEDTTGLLQWLSADRATIKIGSAKEIKDKKDLLKKVFKQWIDATRV